ncbi:spermatogenesis- and oogenesis-specific basic helix-loop-helix-containing protein 1 [Pipistrellus kuhlii]|uniref:spermatogenesis- and oogenesis-specific basic helix-loop-helix-containing protein 1 n=1 Tax=Pipistrellus kuhlii TaxID=59472 RepID=UPI001E273EA3|nr:spermatogenesis- and oogenesis-specific basic helix-loop-helix-containing protein 1 [Pipistrellus kuhlii]
MASGGPEPSAGLARGPTPRACCGVLGVLGGVLGFSGSRRRSRGSRCRSGVRGFGVLGLAEPGAVPSPSSSCSPEARPPRQDPGGGSGPAQTPAGRPACGLPRNVLSERERRKRISLSCKRLRALLPRFDGRREDMASVLEMSVQFLRMAGAVLPGGERPAVLGPTEEDWHKWQLSQTPAEAPGAGPGAPGTMLQDAPSGVTTGVTTGLAEALDRPAALPGECAWAQAWFQAPQKGRVLPGGGGGAVPPSPFLIGTSGLAPWTPGPSPSPVLRPPPAWPPCSWPPTSPLAREEAQSCPGLTGPLTEEATQAGMPGTRSLPACGVEDGPSLLLRASPEWWLGSPEGGDSSAPAGAPAGSPLGRTEPGFLAGPAPSAQETPDGPLEPWGWDVGCPSLAFRDEVDSIFPDFFAG